MGDIKAYAKDCLIIVQDNTPKDTGNEAFNSTMIVNTFTGFRVVSYGYVAPYNIFQQGPRGPKLNHGFWDRAKNSCAIYMTGVISGNKNNLNAQRDRIAETIGDNPARQQLYLNSVSQTLARR